MTKWVLARPDKVAVPYSVAGIRTRAVDEIVSLQSLLAFLRGVLRETLRNFIIFFSCVATTAAVVAVASESFIRGNKVKEHVVWLRR